MAEIIGVKFKEVGKVYYFDPAGFKVEKGQFVIVETVRGVECGECAVGNKEVEDEILVKPLKSIIRIATPEDLKNVERNKEKEKKVAEGLKSSNGYIRRALARAVDLRQTPELTFILDRSGANGAYISSLLHKVEADSAERAARLGITTEKNDEEGDE